MADDLTVMPPIFIRQIQDDFRFRSFRSHGNPAVGCAGGEAVVAAQFESEHLDVELFCPVLITHENAHGSNSIDHRTTSCRVRNMPDRMSGFLPIDSLRGHEGWATRSGGFRTVPSRGPLRSIFASHTGTARRAG